MGCRVTPGDDSVTTAKIEDGAVTPAKLSFNPVTEAELTPSHNHTSASADGGVLTNVAHDGYSDYAEIAAPSSPAANTARLYSKDVAGVTEFFYKNSAGTERDLSSTGGGLADQGTATYLDFTEAAAPSTPASNKVRIYAKSDGSFYQKDDAGTETGLAGGGGTLTIEEVDTSPTVSATKLVFPNGTLGVVGTVATYTPTTGAPTTAPYITTAADAGLSAEIVIPPLALNHNQPGWPSGFAGILEEYDSGSTGLTWSASNPATHNSNSTVPHHRYVNVTDAATRYGTRAWAPSAAFDARCHVSMGGIGGWSTGLWVGDTTGSAGVLLAFSLINTGPSMAAYTVSGGSLTQRGGTWLVGNNAGYLRVSRDGSNNVTHYWSHDGILWVTIATTSFSFTPAAIGYRVSTGSGNQVMISDWLRTDL